MVTAYRPTPLARPAWADPYVLLAGDGHCHVSPPDNPWHVERNLATTIEIARDEDLDFIVLTPHVPARFFADPELREYVAREQRALVESVSRMGVTDLALIVGFEYTDHDFGHATVAFADLDRVLATVLLDEAAAHPALFFERYSALGGLVWVNHPYFLPVDSSLPTADWNLSWRGWTTRRELPEEIAAIERTMVGAEAYNLTLDHLRDRFVGGDAHASLDSAMRQLELEMRRQQRRLVPTGGTDSHQEYLRSTVFVLAEGRGLAQIRDAFLRGRVCIKSPNACSLQVRLPGGAWRPLGASVRSESSIEVRAFGDEIEVLVDGQSVAIPSSGEVVRIPVSADRGCTFVRVRVDGGESAWSYVNCAF